MCDMLIQRRMSDKFGIRNHIYNICEINGFPVNGLIYTQLEDIE